MISDDAAVTGEVTELLQQLIRNACVNDGERESGFESRSADVLQNYLEGAGLDVQRYEAVPGRASVVARIEGSNPDAPTLMLMGHTDVVPVTPERWERDPFGGEVVDGEVWGRGAVDMLNLTASMAVATRRLADQGFRPEGTLVYLGVADEEAAGHWGADWLIEHEADAMACDYVITESGGLQIPMPSGIKLPVIVGEKGISWLRLRVHGTPGHGSRPFRTDNALVKAAEVVRRISNYRAPTEIHDIWRRFVEAAGFPDDFKAILLDPERLYDSLVDLPMEGLAREFHACTHTTFMPSMVKGGVKHNVIPDTVEVAIDIRTLPGQTPDDVRAMLADALGDMADAVEIDVVAEDGPSSSPVDTPLWDCLQRVTDALLPGAQNVPYLTVGGTDARYFRRLGKPAYGFGLFSSKLGLEDYSTMFHGDNERVDQESLLMSERLWEAVAADLLG